MDHVNSHPRARKTHVCQTCYRIIRVGETYRRCVTFDGTAHTWLECVHCETAVRLWSDEIVWDDCYSADSFSEWEPLDVAGLRAKVNHRRKWARADGTLVEVPS